MKTPTVKLLDGRIIPFSEYNKAVHGFIVERNPSTDPNTVRVKPKNLTVPIKASPSGG